MLECKTDMRIEVLGSHDDGQKYISPSPQDPCGVLEDQIAENNAVDISCG